MGGLVQLLRKFNPREREWNTKPDWQIAEESIFENRYHLRPTYNIYVFSLGGTAFMEEGEKGLMPSGSLDLMLEELKKRKPEKLEFILNSGNISFHNGDLGAGLEVQIVPHQICNVDSNDLTFDHLRTLCNNLSRVSNDPLTLGAVTIIGTDRLAPYSRLTELFLKDLKIPVVFTGAQFPASDSRSAFFDNLASSLFFATQDYKGVFVCFDHGKKIFVPKNLVKYSSVDEDAFRNVCLRDAVLVGDGFKEAINEIARIDFGSSGFNFKPVKNDILEDFDEDSLAGIYSGVFDKYFFNRFGRENFILPKTAGFEAICGEGDRDIGPIGTIFPLTHPCFCYHREDDLEILTPREGVNYGQRLKRMIMSSSDECPAVIIEGTGIGNLGRDYSKILSDAKIPVDKLIVLVSNAQDIVDLTTYEAAAPLEKWVLSYSGTLADAEKRLRCVLGMKNIIEKEIRDYSRGNISFSDVARALFMSGAQLPRGSLFEYENKLRIPMIQEDLLVNIPLWDAIPRAITSVRDLKNNL